MRKILHQSENVEITLIKFSLTKFQGQTEPVIQIANQFEEDIQYVVINRKRAYGPQS